jgi:Golgi SNAP receptor complex protein 1
MLLKERGSLQAAHSELDEVLGRAAEAQNALGRQRATIAGAANRLSGIASRIPGLSQLMQAISRRRLKNDIIVAFVVALLICFTIWWLLSAKSWTFHTPNLLSSGSGG